MNTSRSGSGFEPAYLKLLEAGGRAGRAEAALGHLEDCDLCARYCRVNRRQTVAGAVCRTGERAMVASFGAHHGDEDCLRGRRGSGTIFFGWCNLRCVFCQNWNISQKGAGRVVTPRELADIMLELQAEGCHSINLVSSSHVVAQVIVAVDDAARRGLRLPLVHNTGGYDSPEALALLEGSAGAYTCNAVALEDAEGCALPLSRLEEIPHEMQDLAHRLNQIMSKEIVQDQRVMALLGGKSAEARLAAFLVDLSQRFAARGYVPSDIELPMTREDIGSYLGLKLETVSRIFSKLRDEKLIDVQQRHIRILDMTGLERLL